MNEQQESMNDGESNSRKLEELDREFEKELEKIEEESKRFVLRWKRRFLFVLSVGSILLGNYIYFFVTSADQDAMRAIVGLGFAFGGLLLLLLSIFASDASIEDTNVI